MGKMGGASAFQPVCFPPTTATQWTLTRLKHVPHIVGPYTPKAAHKLLPRHRQHQVAVRRRVREEPFAGAVVEPSDDDALLGLAITVEDDGVRLDGRLPFRRLDEGRALHRIDLSLIHGRRRPLPFAVPRSG